MPPSGSFTNPLPNPWYGSPNTTFLGDISAATSSDPDESAVLITNTGSSAVTLSQGVSIGGLSLWDSLIPLSGLTIPAGNNVIFSGTTSANFDGSDGVFKNDIISITLNGIGYSFTSSAIYGGPSSTNETISWSQAGVVATPIPGAVWFFGSALAGFVGFNRKKLV